MTRLLLPVVVALLASGCFTTRAEMPGTWRRPAPREDIVVVGRVDHETTHWFFLWGLLPPPSPSLHAEPLLRAVEAARGDGVANVILDARFTVSDVVVRTLTLGVLAPRTYRVRADIVRIPGPPPPGRPLLRRRGGARVGPEPVPPPPPSLVGAPPSAERGR